MCVTVQPPETGMEVVSLLEKPGISTVDQNRIRLAPGRAFGRGDHATTALCLEMIRAFVKRGHTFLDVGTGTGILMIAAARLGAAYVTGFDRDPSSAAAARDNLALNGYDRRHAFVFCGGHPGLLKTRFDLLAINILPETIVALMDGVAGVLKPDGVVVCSGMIRGNTHRVEGAMKRAGLKMIRSFR